jgi:hypothetical protein
MWDVGNVVGETGLTNLALAKGLNMVRENNMNPLSIGVVVSVRGSVVDIRFDTHFPPIYSLLRAKEGEIAIEVLAQLDAHRVRGIALTPTQGLAGDRHQVLHP